MVLIIFLVGRVLALRMHNYLNELDDEIAQLERQRNQTDEELKTNNVYVEQWDSISGFVNEPVDERRANFITYLQQLEQQSEILITSQGPFSARRMEENRDFQTLSYKLSFSCDLKGLVEFLALLDEEDKRLLRTDSLKIVPRQRSMYPSLSRYGQDLPGARALSV